MRISYPTIDGALYVRLDGSAEADSRQTRRAAILLALKTGPMAAMRLSNMLFNQGDKSVDVHLVEAVLTQMLRAGEVVHQEGGDWAIAPRARGGNANPEIGGPGRAA
jgi:hypothetical protein